jgi:hypothetical protein
MRQAGPTRAGYAQVVAERDLAIADRDFLLNLVMDLGVAARKCQRVSYRRTARGVTISGSYPSSADAITLSVLMGVVRAMVSNAPPQAPERAVAAYQARVAAQMRM